MLRNRKVSVFPVADENGAVIGVVCEAGRRQRRRGRTADEAAAVVTGSAIRHPRGIWPAVLRRSVPVPGIRQPVPELGACGLAARSGWLTSPGCHG